MSSLDLEIGAPLYLRVSTKSRYVGIRQWGVWLRPFDPDYEYAVRLTRFGPGSRDWFIGRKPWARRVRGYE